MTDVPDGGAFIYDSKERGSCYNCIRVLWCGCCEPYHEITSKYVKILRCTGCGRETDSMSMESIFDIERRQSLFCCLASCCCPCCIEDFGSIHLFGRDKENENGIELKHVAHSKKVTETVSKLLEEIHKDFRLQGRNLGEKLQEVKKEP